MSSLCGEDIIRDSEHDVTARFSVEPGSQELVG